MGNHQHSAVLLGHSPQQKPWPNLPVFREDRINGILVNQIQCNQFEDEGITPATADPIVTPSLPVYPYFSRPIRNRTTQYFITYSEKSIKQDSI